MEGDELAIFVNCIIQINVSCISIRIKPSSKSLCFSIMYNCASSIDLSVYVGSWETVFGFHPSFALILNKKILY